MERVDPALTILFDTIRAGKMEYSVATMIWRSLGDLITGKYGNNDLSGPVGTMDIIGDAVAGANTSEGMMTLIYYVPLRLPSIRNTISPSLYAFSLPFGDG